ncbi:MAG: MBL fold metallo-hydrolase [Deltaproteobacteria bacterium]|nr:MBL fold metallo-hydrolase [Deltaproteobacteria bacterium]
MLKINRMVVGPLYVNSYILWDSESKEGIIVDPGDEGEMLLNEIDKKNIILKRVIITHGHFDHLKDAAYVSSKAKVPVLANKEDLPLIEAAPSQAALFGFPQIKVPRIDSYIKEGDIVQVGSYGFMVLDTPGHSPGSITLYNKQERIAVVGDLLFLESIGRTDFFGGDYKTLLLSIKDRILTMADDTLVLSGHGNETTVGHEKAYNPFLTEFYRNET